MRPALPARRIRFMPAFSIPAAALLREEMNRGEPGMPTPPRIGEDANPLVRPALISDIGPAIGPNDGGKNGPTAPGLLTGSPLGNRIGPPKPSPMAEDGPELGGKKGPTAFGFLTDPPPGNLIEAPAKNPLLSFACFSSSVVSSF